MKTAEEILIDTILNYGYKTVYIGTPYEVINKQFVSKSEVERLKYEIIEYAKQACKEQREICAKKAELGRTGIGISLDSITNAPEPNLE